MPKSDLDARNKEKRGTGGVSRWKIEARIVFREIYNETASRLQDDAIAKKNVAAMESPNGITANTGVEPCQLDTCNTKKKNTRGANAPRVEYMIYNAISN